MFEARRILIVEDEPLIGMDLADAVVDLNGVVIGPLPTVAEAMRILDHQSIAAAIVDAVLRDCDITSVALRLARAGIPFVVHSGTGLPPQVAAEWPDLPVILKPARASAVAERLLAEIRIAANRRSDGPTELRASYRPVVRC